MQQCTMKKGENQMDIFLLISSLLSVIITKTVLFNRIFCFFFSVFCLSNAIRFDRKRCIGFIVYFMQCIVCSFDILFVVCRMHVFNILCDGERVVDFSFVFCKAAETCHSIRYIRSKE